MAVGRRAAHLVSYWIARKVNDPKYVGNLDQTVNECPLPGLFLQTPALIIQLATASPAFSG